MTESLLIPIIMTIVGAATPILLAALGELVVEKSGVLNLGVEGMMLIGAVTGFAVTATTGYAPLGVVAAMIAAAASAGLFGFPDPHADRQPGGDGPGADHFRHRPVGAGR